MHWASGILRSVRKHTVHNTTDIRRFRILHEQSIRAFPMSKHGILTWEMLTSSDSAPTPNDNAEAWQTNVLILLEMSRISWPLPIHIQSKHSQPIPNPPYPQIRVATKLKFTAKLTSQNP